MYVVWRGTAQGLTPEGEFTGECGLYERVSDEKFADLEQALGCAEMESARRYPGDLACDVDPVPVLQAHFDPEHYTGAEFVIVEEPH